MLTRDVTLEDFAHEDWLRLLGLFGMDPGQGSGRGAGVVALTARGRIVKLHSTRSGAVDLSSVPFDATPAEMATLLGARWAVSMEGAALSELVDRFAARLRPELGALDQAFELLRIARDLESAGRLAAHPRSFSSMPLLTEAIVSRTLDVVCPEGRSLMLGSFEEGALHTSVVAHRCAGGFDRVLGPERLRRDVGLVSGVWARDCHRVARAAELAAGRLSLGAFAEASTWRRLLRDDAPGAWARAVAARELVLHPLGPAVALPLGVDVSRVAYRALRSFAQKLAEDAPPALDRLRDAWPRAGGFSDLLAGGALRRLSELLDRETRGRGSSE